MSSRKRLALLDKLDFSTFDKVKDEEFDNVEDLSLIDFDTNPEVFQPELARELVPSILLEGRVVTPIKVVVREGAGGKSFRADCVEGRELDPGLSGPGLRERRAARGCRHRRRR
jgi:hypothetical protein